MFNPPRCKAVLSAAGYSDAKIARAGKIVHATVINLDEYPNRDFRFNDRALFFAACKVCRFPWAAAANPQLHAMAKETRSDSPDALTNLLPLTGRTWIQAVEATSGNDTLDEGEWTDLAFAIVYANGLVQASRKEMQLPEVNRWDAAAWLAAEARWWDVKKTYELVSSEMLKRLDQVDTSSAADAAWVDFLRYDVTVNRVVVPWELSGKDEQALAELREAIENIDFFSAFYRFNERVPKCHLSPYNALGFASVLGRSDLFEDLWLNRLARADRVYEDYRKVLDDRDSGPEFDNFGAWARDRYAEGDTA